MNLTAPGLGVDDMPQGTRPTRSDAGASEPQLAGRDRPRRSTGSPIRYGGRRRAADGGRSARASGRRPLETSCAPSDAPSRPDIGSAGAAVAAVAGLDRTRLLA